MPKIKYFLILFLLQLVFSNRISVSRKEGEGNDKEFADFAFVCGKSAVKENENTGEIACQADSLRDIDKVKNALVPKIILLHDQMLLRETGLMQDYLAYFQLSQEMFFRMEDSWAGYVASCCELNRLSKKCEVRKDGTETKKSCPREQRLFLEYFRDLNELHKDATSLYQLSQPQIKAKKKKWALLKFSKKSFRK